MINVLGHTHSRLVKACQLALSLPLSSRVKGRQNCFDGTDCHIQPDLACSGLTYGRQSGEPAAEEDTPCPPQKPHVCMMSASTGS